MTTASFILRRAGPTLAPMPPVMPPLPDHQEVIEEIDDAHPLRMVTAPARSYLNSSFTETPTLDQA